MVQVTITRKQLYLKPKSALRNKPCRSYSRTSRRKWVNQWCATCWSAATSSSFQM